MIYLRTKLGNYWQRNTILRMNKERQFNVLVINTNQLNEHKYCK
jgi:hypothetical protein